jgi:hypothetical protein
MAGPNPAVVIGRFNPGGGKTRDKGRCPGTTEGVHVLFEVQSRKSGSGNRNATCLPRFFCTGSVSIAANGCKNNNGIRTGNRKTEIEKQQRHIKNK